MIIPNRTICDVFSEMRECYKISNFSYLLGLIEEAQTMANRMESRLWDQKDFDRAKERHRKLKKKIEKLEDELED